MNIHDFDDIRPFLPEELPEVYDRLLANPDFQSVIQTVYQNVPFEQVAALMRSTKDANEFQTKLVYPVLTQLIQKASTGLTSNLSNVLTDQEKSKCHTFVSNHRDIVLDSALLCYVLQDNKLTTVEIAIGDNLLIKPWILDLVRVNKSFIVQRALTMRQMLLASAKLSKYMHFAINEKHENVWIAQREGRAKDSNDRTQESVLKMMSMGGDLRKLNIVPLSISYEFDPCDYLKAQEFQNKRDIEGFKKSKQDDLDNMRIGIFGPKGHIHYHAAPCINEWLNTLPADMPKADYFKAVAEHIDQEIHAHYQLYPSNYIAADLLRGNNAFADKYTAEQKAQFQGYMQKKLSMVQLEKPDMPFLTERFLTMYANVVFNQEEAIKK